MTTDTDPKAYLKQLRATRDLADRISDHLMGLELGPARVTPDVTDCAVLEEVAVALRNAVEILDA